jgi:hypothetical protein
MPVPELATIRALLQILLILNDLLSLSWTIIHSIMKNPCNKKDKEPRQITDQGFFDL